MPIGHYAITKHAGTIKFYSDFVISIVLYVPKFSLSLMSVSKLCIALGCTVTFNSFKLHYLALCLSHISLCVLQVRILVLVLVLLYQIVPYDTLD